MPDSLLRDLLEDIAANDYNLNISQYVAPKDECEVLTVAAAMAQGRLGRRVGN